MNILYASRACPRALADLSPRRSRALARVCPRLPARLPPTPLLCWPQHVQPGPDWHDRAGPALASETDPARTSESVPITLIVPHPTGARRQSWPVSPPREQDPRPGRPAPRPRAPAVLSPRPILPPVARARLPLPAHTRLLARHGVRARHTRQPACARRRLPARRRRQALSQWFTHGRKKVHQT